MKIKMKDYRNPSYLAWTEQFGTEWACNRILVEIVDEDSNEQTQPESNMNKSDD